MVWFSSKLPSRGRERETRTLGHYREFLFGLPPSRPLCSQLQRESIKMLYWTRFDLYFFCSSVFSLDLLSLVQFSFVFLSFSFSFVLYFFLLFLLSFLFLHFLFLFFLLFNFLAILSSFSRGVREGKSIVQVKMGAYAIDLVWYQYGCSPFTCRFLSGSSTYSINTAFFFTSDTKLPIKTPREEQCIISPFSASSVIYPDAVFMVGGESRKSSLDAGPSVFTTRGWRWSFMD